ncbi:MAG: MFS transporter [Balneolales bacterium]
MYNRKHVFIAACLGMLVYGTIMSVLGAVLPSVITKFGLNKVDAGSLFLLMTLGILIGSLIFGPIVDRFGYKGILIGSTVIVFLGFFGISQAPSLLWIRTSLLVIGFAGGMLNGGTNTIVSDISTGSRGSGLTYLGAFFGIGAFGVPFILGVSLDYFSYEVLIGGVGSLVLIPLIYFIFLRFPAPKQVQGFPVAEGLSLTKESTLLLFGLILFMQSGLEITIGGWSAAFLIEELAFEERSAVLMLSIYWLGFLVARIIAGKLLQRYSSAAILKISIGTSFIGIILFFLAQDAILVVTGLFLLGLGFAPVFPVILGYVGDTFAKLSGTAFGLVLAMATAGGMFYPYVTGILADLYSLRLALILIPISLVSIVFFIRLVHMKMANVTAPHNIASNES